MNIEEHWRRIAVSTTMGPKGKILAPNGSVLSIIAGPGAYSEPREPAEKYTRVEIAVVGDDGSWLNPGDGLPEEFGEEVDWDDVAGYVTWGFVQRVWHWLQEQP